ncbi:MAG: hypothetical protein IPI45_04575 [Saprospiraceae bacterium]|nr:hypothetical protein [Saprospiraceae bacterium]
MNKIYSWAAQLLLSKVLGGKKTMILGWTSTAIGTFNIMFSTENLQAICEQHGICLQTSAVFGTILVIIGEATKILRYATGQSYRDPDFFKH